MTFQPAQHQGKVARLCPGSHAGFKVTAHYSIIASKQQISILIRLACPNDQAIKTEFSRSFLDLARKQQRSKRREV
jgi:hypothetical protein